MFALGERGSIFLACRLNFPAGSRGNRATRYRLLRKGGTSVRRDSGVPTLGSTSLSHSARTRSAPKIRRRDLPTLSPRRRRRRQPSRVRHRRTTHARTHRKACTRAPRLTWNHRSAAMRVGGRRHRRPGQCDARRNRGGQSPHAVNSLARKARGVISSAVLTV